MWIEKCLRPPFEGLMPLLEPANSIVFGTAAGFISLLHAWDAGNEM
jgi:hypothetical protein